MTLLFQSHGGKEQAKVSQTGPAARAAPPAVPDIAADEQADFGYFFPPSTSANDYLPASTTTVTELDALGAHMIEAPQDPHEADSTMPPVLTYWGQFLDHELTARTDRESAVTNITAAHPPGNPAAVEGQLRNARTPRFDLDSVYGGIPVGGGLSADVATVINGMRHPTDSAKMRVGTATEDQPLPDILPDDLDPHRDLPRYIQVQQSVRDAALRLAQNGMPPADFTKFQAGLMQRAVIGDQRNDENLAIAQFHLSFLRFHNKAVDYLRDHNTGWIADFSAAQTLTRLHYQWLIVNVYLKGVCDPAAVTRVVNDRASHFFKFRAEYDARKPGARLGNAVPLEFSAAAYRFGHSMVRDAYDYNRNFGRGSGPGHFIDFSPLNLLFAFTGGGGAIDGNKRLPKKWVIDWTRFVGIAPLDHTDGKSARFARKIDTSLAPPLAQLVKEGPPLEEDPSERNKLFKHLARRNLRRGYNLKLPTGQALHAYLKANGAVMSNPIADVSALFNAKPGLKTFLANSQSHFHQKTPLWFYILAEAEAAGGNHLGEMGSWLVASTFVGILLADPDSALSKGFAPSQSPLRMADNSVIDTLAKWMKFAVVMP
jgi:Animal haem peroxidase